MQGPVEPSHPLVVMKFGGATLASPDRIRLAAERILEKRRSNRVVVVASAMGDETDRLLELTREFPGHGSPGDVDAVLAAGEQVAAGLLALAIRNRGGEARSFLAHQVPIVADGRFGDGRILHVAAERLDDALRAGVIPVVAGFQGIDGEGRLVTLGRGGSDTSAVAIAASLGAETCELYKDVDGIYSDDPRKVPSARRYRCLSYGEMERIAEREPQILHHKAVRIAKSLRIRLHVRSAFKDAQGTIVEDRKVEEASA